MLMRKQNILEPSFRLHQEKGDDEERLSILVIGACGKTSLECIREFSFCRRDLPAVHAFSPDHAKLLVAESYSCESVIQGDYHRQSDIEDALIRTKASLVLFCIEASDEDHKDRICTKAAGALARVLGQPRFQHVHVMMVSCIGSQTLRARLTFERRRCKHILEDYMGQEAAFRGLEERTMIVRAAAFTSGKCNGRMKEYADGQKKPKAVPIDRVDFASWLVNQAVCDDLPIGDNIVYVMGSRT